MFSASISASMSRFKAVFGILGRRCFTGEGDILCTRCGEDVFGLGDFLQIIGVD
jgi:hypothetical protein